MALNPVDALVIQLTDAIRAQVITEIKGMSLSELLAFTGGGGNGVGTVKRGPGRPKTGARGAARAKRRGRQPSLSATSKLKLHDRVVEMIRGTGGVRAEAIRNALNVKKQDLVKVLAHGLEAGTITKTGEKRATKYFAAESSSKAGKK